MKLLFPFISLLCATFNDSSAGLPGKLNKPDLTVKAWDFRLDGAAKKIYFKVQISNIGTAACTINSSFGIQTYLSADATIGNDLATGGRFIPYNIELAPGKTILLNQEFFLAYQTLGQLEENPYCVIEIYKPGLELESNYENNKSIYKHGFPRKKGEGLSKNPGDVPIKTAIKYIDLKLQIANVTSELITEPETGKQYKEYTYTATVKNIGNMDAVIDLQKPVSLRYWNVASCTDTSGMSSIQKPTDQHVSYLLKPQQSFVLTQRKVKQKPDATTPLLVELIYEKPEKNKWNNFACLQN